MSKQLTLAKGKDKKVLGVAGGIAHYFDADPAWVRIVALIAIIITGVVPGLLFYFLIGKTAMPAAKSAKTAKKK